MSAPAAFTDRLISADRLARSYIPRAERPMVWGRRAHDQRMQNKAPGESPMRTAIEAACAMIGGAFSMAAHHNATKLAVETAMRRGEWAFQTRLRYHQIAFGADLRSIDVTLHRLDLQIAGERRHNARLRQGGLATMVKRVPENLIEARLFCRWFRRYGERARWPAIIDALTTAPQHAPPYHIEAAE